MKYGFEEYTPPEVEILQIDLEQVIAVSGDIDDYGNEDYGW